MADFLQGETKVPVLGKTKKWVVYGVGGLAAAYVAWKWYQNGTADEPTGDDMVYNPDLSEYGQSTAGGPFNVGGNNGSTVTDGTSPDAIDDNAEWTQKAVELLANAGYDPAVVYAALGEFLARRALDKTEATIARAAIAAAGEPPIGRPWTVIEESSTGTGTLPAPSGLKSTSKSHTAVSLAWSSVSGAGSYQVYRNGSAVVTANGTSATVGGLSAETTYKFSVAAISTTGKTGTRSGEISVKTDKAPTASKPPTTNPPKDPSRHRTMRITRRGQTLSHLVNEYNRKYGTRHTWQEIWNFNLKYRPASTVKTLKARGPNKVYIGSSFWFPY